MEAQGHSLVRISQREAVHLNQPGQLLVFIVNTYQQGGYGVKMMTPWSRLNKEVASILFIDNTHLLQLRNDLTWSEDGFVERVSKTTSGAEIIQTIDGNPKPFKCFKHLLLWKFVNGEAKPVCVQETVNLPLLAIPQPGENTVDGALPN